MEVRSWLQLAPKGRGSEDEWSFDIKAVFGTVVFDFMLPIAAEMVEAEAIGSQVDSFEQFTFECYQLSWVNFAFEN